MCSRRQTSVYTVHMTMVPRGSFSVYIVHVVKLSIRNNVAKLRLGSFEFRNSVMCDHALRILSLRIQQQY